MSNKKRWYFHPEHGEPSDTPWNKRDAVTFRQPQYRSDQPCPHCGTNYPYLYVRSDICVGCVMRDFSELTRFGLKWADTPPTLRVLQMYGSTTFGDPPCPHGPHQRQENPETHRCRGCEIELGKAPITAAQQIDQNLGANLTRDQARDAGFTLYHDGTQCLRGHPGWRYVSTGQCWFCARGAEGEAPADAPQARPGRPLSPEAQMALDNPDMVLSRADARALGMGLFRTGEPCKYGHTGWRRADSGACLDCLRNRNT